MQIISKIWLSNLWVYIKFTHIKKKYMYTMYEQIVCWLYDINWIYHFMIMYEMICCGGILYSSQWIRVLVWPCKHYLPIWIHMNHKVSYNWNDQKAFVLLKEILLVMYRYLQTRMNTDRREQWWQKKRKSLMTTTKSFCWRLSEMPEWTSRMTTSSPTSTAQIPSG